MTSFAIDFIAMNWQPVLADSAGRDFGLLFVYPIRIPELNLCIGQGGMIQSTCVPAKHEHRPAGLITKKYSEQVGAPKCVVGGFVVWLINARWLLHGE
jgi:hypothetical protein